jgi:cytochrome oxidase assembly protein ShyY1
MNHINTAYSKQSTSAHQSISIVMIMLLAFVLLLLFALSLWQFNRGFEKQEISKQFDLSQKQGLKNIKTMAEFNDFNNLDAPPPIFTQIKIKGFYSQSPQDIVWVERFTEFQANDTPEQEISPTQNIPHKNLNPNHQITLQAKAPHYLMLQKLYIEKSTNNIRPIWVWRGISQHILTTNELEKMPTQVEKVMRVIPRIPQILTLGDNCYLSKPAIKIDFRQNNDSRNIFICQNFDHQKHHAKFIMMDATPDNPLHGIEKLETLKAHFVKISPQRHFAYGTTWLALALVIIFIIIYRSLKNKKDA